MTVVTGRPSTTRPIATHPSNSHPDSHPDNHASKSHPRDAHPSASDAGAHLLRLAANLQLDAMMFMLGASAARGEDCVPWRRWLAEDVAMSRELAATALGVQGNLPSVFHPRMASAEPTRLLEDLLAHCTALRDLLEDVVSKPVSTAPASGSQQEDDVIDLTDGTARRSAARGRPDADAQLRRTLDRCRARLVEVHQYLAASS